ncbi:MAG: GNAT family N-acetyltransferase [Chloroflexi bacterium]|nr:GNAT family N-acetyltransferase [Chloroflexota bacterium]
MGPITVRMMNEKDVAAIAEIDTRVLGSRRQDYWTMKMQCEHARSPVPALVAEADGHVVGFIMGAASGWEYGVPATIGWVDTLGVHPEYQGQGVASLLAQELVAHMKKVGVSKVYTLVNWRNGDMLRFFDKLGFTQGDMINLELDI